MAAKHLKHTCFNHFFVFYESDSKENRGREFMSRWEGCARPGSVQ